MALQGISESKQQLRVYRTEIKEAHAEFESGARTSIAAAKRIGAALAGAKGELEHGEFMPWVEKHCPFSHETANAYMRVAKAIEGSNSQSSTNLLPDSIGGILKAITPKKVENTAPKPPKPAGGDLDPAPATAPTGKPRPTKIEPAKPAGPEIPERLADIASGEFVTESVETLNKLVKRVKKEANGAYGPWMTDLAGLVEHLTSARNQIVNLAFGEVCPECEGAGEDCCRNTGWLPEWRRVEKGAGG